jgi:hypothetical protein
MRRSPISPSSYDPQISPTSQVTSDTRSLSSDGAHSPKSCVYEEPDLALLSPTTSAAPRDRLFDFQIEFFDNEAEARTRNGTLAPRSPLAADTNCLASPTSPSQKLRKFSGDSSYAVTDMVRERRPSRFLYRLSSVRMRKPTDRRSSSVPSEGLLPPNKCKSRSRSTSVASGWNSNKSGWYSDSEDEGPPESPTARVQKTLSSRVARAIGRLGRRKS